MKPQSKFYSDLLAIACSLGYLILIVKTVVFWIRRPEKRIPIEFSMSIIGWSIDLFGHDGLPVYAC